MKKINIQELLKTGKKINPQELLSTITQNKNILILSILTILIILYLDFSFGLKPQMHALGAMGPKIDKVKRELKQFNADSIRMQRQVTGVKPGQVKEMLSSGQMAWIIEEISRMANQQEVEIFQIKPRRKVQTTTLSKNSLQQDNYPPAIIDLEVSAGYHQFGRFLAELENYSVLLETEEVDINRSDKPPFEHKVKLQLKTYVSE